MTSFPQAAPRDERTAVLVLGCPQVPVQTSVAIYLSAALRRHGLRTVIAGNSAARILVDVADPVHHYTGAMVDLDSYITDLSAQQKDYDLSFVFIHNDAGVVYATTVSSLSRSLVVTLVYGEQANELATQLPDTCEKIVAKAVHNPLPLRRKIDEVLPWVVSRR